MSVLLRGMLHGAAPWSTHQVKSSNLRAGLCIKVPVATTKWASDDCPLGMTAPCCNKRLRGDPVI